MKKKGINTNQIYSKMVIKYSLCDENQAKLRNNFLAVWLKKQKNGSIRWLNILGNYFMFESIKKAYTVKILKISLIVKKKV